jgi:hypothetical protein
MHNHEAVDPSPFTMNQLKKNPAALVKISNFTYTKDTHPNNNKKSLYSKRHGHCFKTNKNNNHRNATIFSH